MSLFTEGLGGLLQFCTANFLFHGSDGNRYLGTAGHCSGASEGTATVYPPGHGRFADNASATGMPRIGEYAYVVYTSMNDLSRIRDFALIRLNPNVAAMASVCYFGGPTGIATGVIQRPFVVHHVGNGIGFGLVLRARSGVATRVTDPNWGAFLGLGIPGDSGSPVLYEDGRALGVLVQAHALPVSGSGVGDNVYVRPQPMMDAAEAALGIHLTLDTAPVA
jgi:hypothetical protein